MDYSKFYDQVYKARDPKPKGTSGWIQWKGTDVCMDIHCVCGYHSHVDTDFFYNFRCPQCKQAYAVGQNISLIPLTTEEEAFVDSRGDTFHTVELEERPKPAPPEPPLTAEQQALVETLKAEIGARLREAVVGERTTPDTIARAEQVVGDALRKMMPETDLSRIKVDVTSDMDDPRRLQVVVSRDGVPVTDEFLAKGLRP